MESGALGMDFGSPGVGTAQHELVITSLIGVVKEIILLLLLHRYTSLLIETSMTRKVNFRRV